MTGEASGSVWRCLRVWLLGGSLGAVAALLPLAAQAKEHHHEKRLPHHAGHQHVRIDRVALRHSEHYEDRAGRGHSSGRELHARLSHVDYRHETSGRDRDAHLIRADYRSDNDRYHSQEGRDRNEAVGLTHVDYETGRSHYRYGRHIVARFSYSRLQCVPYAREVSHIELEGDAFLWWAEAAGRYQRGYMPVVGSVLNFRSTSRMPLGHVAVVTAVLGSRQILVTQANWVPGTVTNDVTVEDVSPDNNWSEVRVEYDNSSAMGAAYPTYGFIYDKPAYAPTIYAANAGGRNEVAEAPSVRPIANEAPNRNLR